MKKETERQNDKTKPKKEATLLISVLTLAVVVAFVAAGVSVLNLDISLMLFLCWLVVAPFAAVLGYNFFELEDLAYEMAKNCIGPAAIIMAVGVMMGAFMAAGTVPTVLVAGLQVITPGLFLVTTFILCCMMSMIMGTSWGTIGTIGIAMSGVGLGLGMDPAITAGAIVGGAWFGDKMSPMSDSTNLCAAVTKTKLMDHVRYMLWTTGPAAVISIVLYGIIGFSSSANAFDRTQVAEIIGSLRGLFKIDFVAVIPLIVVIVMIIMRKSTIVSLLSGTVTAAVVAVLYQGVSLADIGSVMYGGYSVESDNAVIASLLNRGGMSSMLSLIATFVGALGLGGILNGTGLLKPLFDALTRGVKSAKGVMAMAWFLTLICILVISTNNFAFVMVGTLFAPIFEKYNLKSQNLSRILEDVGTTGSVLIPWNVGAMFVVGVLGVPTVQYAPYAYLNIFTPIISLAIALTGFKVLRTDR